MNNLPWEWTIDGVQWALRRVAELIEPVIGGSYSRPISIIVVTVALRTLMLTFTRRQFRALRADRILVGELRGWRHAHPSRDELLALARDGSTTLKEPLVGLLIQAAILIPFYFAVRDTTRENASVRVFGTHLTDSARSSWAGAAVIVAIILISVVSARMMTRHIDHPAARSGAVTGPIMIGVQFFLYPFMSAWALAYLVYVGYELAQASLAFRGSDVAQPEEQQAEVAEGMTILACRNIEFAYERVQVLFGVDLEVKRGEVLALLGTNGSGKSTLLKAISGLNRPIGGYVVFEGRDITDMHGADITALGLVQVPGKSVFPTLTVTENLRAAAWLQRRNISYVTRATDNVQRQFPILRERAHELAGNLSGGEQQMLALAMAFVAEPKVLLIDELSLGLAPTIVEQLLGIVKAIHDNGTTIVLVEQSVDIALRIADRAYFLEKGEVRFQGRCEDLMKRPDLLRSVFLEGAGSVDKVPPRATTSSAECQPVGVDLPLGEIALEARGLCRRFGGIVAVDDVSFVIRDREILGLIGPNGSGKTTIVDIVSGLLPPDAGTVLVNGSDISSWSPSRRAMAGLGRSFQDARLFPSLSVAENLAIALERHLEIRDHLAAALHLPAVVELEDDIAWTVKDLIEVTGLGPFRDKLASELSTGTRRIVDLGMTIAHNPSVLLLDEPSSGIAQRETEAMGPMLVRIRDETGAAMVIIEHDMPMLMGIADRMLALETGRVIAEGTPAEIVRHPRVIESYLGTNQHAEPQLSGAHGA